MIEFTCPGCRSSHLANEAFVGMRARCVVCGAFIRIPAQSGADAELLDGYSSRPARPRRLRAASRSARPADGEGSSQRGESDDDLDRAVDLADVDQADDDLVSFAERELEQHPVASPRPAPRARVAAAPGYPDDLDAEEPPADEQPTRNRPATPLPDPPNRRKQLIQIGSIAGAILVLAVGGYIAFSGDTPPPPPPQQAEQPPPKTEPPAPPAPKPAPIPAVSAQIALRVAFFALDRIEMRLAGPPVEINAARAIADRAANPREFDAAMTGKRLLVRGTLGRIQADAITLSDRAVDESGGTQEVVCTLWQPEAGKKLTVQPGEPVTVQGVYTGNLRLTRCEVVRVDCAGDAEYRDRLIELTGVVGRANVEGDEGERFPYFNLEAPTTDSPLAVRFLFRQTQKEGLAKLKPGQTVTVRGRCAGRLFRMVHFHDCVVVEPGTPPAAATRVALDRFFAAYETDILAADRPDPAAGPIPVGAEQLAAAFGENRDQADASYRNRVVQVTGRLLSRVAGAVLLETGTGQKYQIQAAFTSAKFAAVKDEPVVTLRGTCVGVRGAYVRLENAERVDAGVPDSTEPRITAEFLPLKPGRELTYDVLVPSQTKAPPTVTRYAAQFRDPDRVEFTALRSGAILGASLFADPVPQPKWTKDYTKSKPKDVPRLASQFRLEKNVVELRDLPEPPAQPSTWWDPVLKLGLKKGEVWSGETPDGRKVTYTVEGFGRDDAGRDTLTVRREEKHPRDPNVWEERAITYTRGVGEVRRTVSRHWARGAVTLLEMRLVEKPETTETPTGKDR